MALRINAAVALTILCLVCVAVTACGVSASAQRGGSTLHVVRIESGEALPSLDTYVNDSAAVQRLNSAALKLPAARGIYHCPADNGVVYHLTFIGGTVAVRQMDLQAAGCRFVVIEQQSYRTNDAFITLFMRTVGISVLDPSMPTNP